MLREDVAPTWLQSPLDIEQTAAQTEAVFARVREVAPDTLLVCHGAAMESVADAQYMLDQTSADGFWTGSSTERLPIERAVSEAASSFAALRFASPSSKETTS